MGKHLYILAVFYTRIRKRESDMRWTDDMVKEYFDTHCNVTIHEICALSGRTKADVKRILMGGN